MILCYEKGKLKEKKSCREALHLESEVSPVISITGAGEDNDRSALGMGIQRSRKSGDCDHFYTFRNLETAVVSVRRIDGKTRKDPKDRRSGMGWNPIRKISDFGRKCFFSKNEGGFGSIFTEDLCNARSGNHRGGRSQTDAM